MGRSGIRPAWGGNCPMRRTFGVLFVVAAFAFATAGEIRSEKAGAEPDAPAAIGLKLYADTTVSASFLRVTYGYDRDAVCAEGRCDDDSVCLAHAACSGIGGGLCNLNQTCTDDFSPNCAPPTDTCGLAVDTLTAGAPPGQNIWELVCDPATPGGTDCQVGASLPATTVSWDFSDFKLANAPDLVKVASTTTPITGSAFTDSGTAATCGFSEAGALLDRQDKNWPVPAETIHTLNSLEREDAVLVCMNGSAATNGKLCASNGDCGGGGSCESTTTWWQRGVDRYDGVAGAFGEGESRLCYVSDGRTEVPLWRFPNVDAVGSYMQLGDSRFEHTAFACENVIVSPFVTYGYACSDFEGKSYGEVVNEGVVKLPSGHQLKALVVQSVTEYCVNLVASCSGFFLVDDVRSVSYLWEVPHIGTVARVLSNKTVQTKTDFIHVAEVDVKYGLFPPLTLTVGSVDSESVQLSWDPGLITDEIDDYHIYWDIESGGRCNIGGEDCNADAPSVGDHCAATQACCSTPGDSCDGYDFDSDTHATQVNFDTPTSATIDGLDPGTTYHFTVNARSSFTDPSTAITTVYESPSYPTRIPAVPVDLPLEVSATTTASCAPSLEVGGLTGSRLGSEIELCWVQPADACIDGYRILGAASPESAANFTTETDTGLVTCETFSPTGSYFLTVGRAGGATGPWGHYGQ